ncbi:centromere protein Chl4/mis15/CENP-N [Tuber indicum]|nr:centromere protein Chl4/mis15/CENP-N [Tuber indicum]
MSKKRKSTTTANALPDTLRIAYTPPVRRLLSRLSKSSLVELSLGWLGSTKVNLTRVEDDEGGEDEDEEGEEMDIEVVRVIYEGFNRSKSVRVKEVVERIVEHEWRDGLTLGMVAELDFRYLLDHPSSQKWTSAQLYPLSKPPPTRATSKTIFHPKTFAHTLSTLLRPLVSPHYYITHHPSLPLHMLHVQLHPPTPTTPLTLPQNKHIFWLAFPESTDGYVFHTLPSSSPATTATTSLPEIVRESIAIAVSRRGIRYGIRAARMSARTLEAVAYHRGGEGDGGMLGGWSIFSAGGVGVDDDVLDLLPARTPPLLQKQREKEEEAGDEQARKRQKIAEARFGTGAKEGDGTGLENVVFALAEEFPPSPALPQEEQREGEMGEGGEEFRPKITVRLEGSHVFAGVRSLVEQGVGFDGAKLPGWLTGEAGVTVGRVRGGKVKGWIGGL